jgi:pyruvate carboxylase
MLNLTEPDQKGVRTAIFELNGYPRHTHITDRSVAQSAVTRLKADPAEKLQVGAPMPGMVASIAVTVGHKVKEGETLLTLEAMKMFTTVTAPTAGTIAELHITVGATVEAKDLMVTLAK